MTNTVPPNSRSQDNDGEWLQTRPGERCLIRVPGSDTDGTYSLVEIISSPGDGTPMHVHDLEDEHIIVLKGIARVAYGDDIFDAHAGATVTLRKGIPHAWGNRSDSQLHIAVLAFPGGCEQVLRLMTAAREADIPALAAGFRVRPVGLAPF
jgi:quercetin dioxygenase-like cupin family protein